MLSVDGISSYYGRGLVLDGVSMRVGEGEFVCILGRNGVGKTSLVRSILGLRPPTVGSGSVTFEGKEVSAAPTFEIASLGVGLVPQGRRVFPSLTVDETLRIAERAGRDSSGIPWTRGQVDDLFPVLLERRKQRAGQMSGGEQAMLALARALLNRPRLMVMDEPAEGLATVVVKALETTLLHLKEAGLTVLLVEQNLKLARAVADRILIMERGTVSSELSSEEFDHRWDEVRRHLGV